MHQFALCYVISISIAYTTPLTQLAPLRQNCLGRSRFNSLFSTPLYDDSVEPEIVGISTSSSSNFVSSQSSGYKTTTLLFTALAIDTHKPHIRAVLLNNPTHLLPSTAPILAAIITWSLKSATINSNLHSDTYKGLNMAGELVKRALWNPPHPPPFPLCSAILIAAELREMATDITSFTNIIPLNSFIVFVSYSYSYSFVFVWLASFVLLSLLH